MLRVDYNAKFFYAPLSYDVCRAPQTARTFHNRLRTKHHSGAKVTHNTPYFLQESNMNAKTVLKYASDQGAKFVSVRFTDLPGSWQHLTFPIGELAEDIV